jgi:hypothetical protein
MTHRPDRPRITPNPDGGFILHLPDVTYIDTQVWSVDVGLTDAGVEALRALLAAPAAGQPPATNQTALETATAVAARLRAEGHDVRAQGADDVADMLRAGERLERQETPVEHRPPRHRWAAEFRDPIADEWIPGTRFLNRHHAVERYEAAIEHASAWKDGTPVERRLVRETTTYTVEAEHTPAVEARQGDPRPASPPA